MHMKFKVTLRDISPKIWRRFTLDERATFADLSAAIQASFGWLGYHLWNFTTTSRRRDVIAALKGDFDEGFFDADPDASAVTLVDFFTAPKTKCIYCYDFGDGWEHDVVFEGRADAPDGVTYQLLGGKRSCPPEDCGGVPGYERFAEFARTGVDPWGEDADELRGWLGEWDPEAFDPAETLIPEIRLAGGAEPIPEDDSGVMELIAKTVRKRGLGPDYVGRARAVWNAYYRANGGPGRRRAKTHAACVDYVTSNLGRDEIPLTQQEAADFYGVSAPSISNNYRDYGDPDDFQASRYYWGPSEPAAPSGMPPELERMLPRLPGQVWSYEVDLSEPPALICRTQDGQVRHRVPAPDIMNAHPGWIAQAFVLPGFIAAPPPGRPDRVIVRHAIFRGIEPILDAVGVDYTFEGPDVTDLPRPEWLDDAISARLLSALAAYAMHSELAPGQYACHIERGDELRYILVIHDSSENAFPAIALDPTSPLPQTLIPVMAADGAAPWFDEVPSTLTTRPAQIVFTDGSASVPPEPQDLEDYIVAVQALAAVLAKFARHGRVLDMFGEGAPGALGAHVEVDGGAAYAFGPMG